MAKARVPEMPSKRKLQRLANGKPELDILHIFSDFVAAHGGSIADEHNQDAFLKHIAAALQQRQPTAVHGLRVEAMFAYVAAAMGQCAMISSLDAGLFLADDPHLRRPDFQVVTTNGQRFLVEVKNQSALKPLRLKASYLAGLEQYAERAGCDLKVAAYWRSLRMWTLVDARYFDREQDRAVLTLSAAAKRNEMSVIGDCAIATIPPLTLRTYTVPAESRFVDDNGTAQITIDRLTFLASGQEVLKPIERKIAFFLLLYGYWDRVEHRIAEKDGEITWYDIEASPEEQDKEAPFPPMVGWLSQMISNQYSHGTVVDESVTLLSPREEPGSLGVLIPPDYKGEVLKLWLLHQQPNYDDFRSGR